MKEKFRRYKALRRAGWSYYQSFIVGFGLWVYSPWWKRQEIKNKK